MQRLRPRGRRSIARRAPTRARGPMELIGAHAALRVGLVLALVVLVALVLPFVSWLVLAAWLAAGVRPWLAILARKLGGRSRAAALLTLAFFLALVGPVVALMGSLSIDAMQLGQQLATSA